MLNIRKKYILMFVIFMIALIAAGCKTNAASRVNQKKTAVRKELIRKRDSDRPPWVQDNQIEKYAHLPEKYQKKVQLADIYVNHCYCSIRTTIFYLKEVEHFSNDEIRYSLSHIRADWKRNAVYTAKALQETHPRWKNDRIALELVEDYYGGFTKEEAAFAMRHIDEVKTTQIIFTPDKELAEYSMSEQEEIKDKEAKMNYANSLWWYNLSSNDLN